MQVALVITRGDEFGGAQLHLSYIAQYLVNKGHHVEVIAGTTGVFTDHLRQKGITVSRLARLSRSVNLINDLLAIRALIKVLDRRGFDLIAAHSSKAGLVAALSARWTKTPIVFTAHSWPFLQGQSTLANWSYRVFSYLTCSLANQVICVCRHDLMVVRDSRFINEGKFSVIHNGIPDLPGAQRSLCPTRTQNICNLVMVARLAYPKNHTLLLKMMSHLRNTRLTLVGDGPDRSALEALCRDLKISDRVDFVGESTTPEVFIASADIMLLVTRSEGFPLCILEGMRAGKPIIASAVGGIPEAIENGNQGYLINPNDPGDLTYKVQSLVTDVDLRLQMGERARNTYESRFLDREMLRKTDTVYQNSLQRPIRR